MTRWNTPFNRHLARRALAPLTLVLACAFVPGSAAARSSGEGALSPRLAALASAPLRQAPPAEQAAQISLAAEGPGSLLRRGNRVLVNVRFDSGAVAAADDLREAGAQTVQVSGRYQTVTAAVTPAALPAVGRVSGVASVTEILAPYVAATGCTGGPVSEGDAQLDAIGARRDWGVDGAGLTVGILSDSFDQDPGAATHAADDIASGDLPGTGNPCGYPTPVSVLETFIPFEAGEVPGDEGRAMAQIVHDLAPASPLAFASAFNGEPGFAANIRRLARPVALGGAGAQVVVDDVGYFEEPFFQDGPVAVAANEVAAAGVSYFSAAGNDNLIDSGGRNIASWEAPAYRDATACPPQLTVLAETENCMDFDPAAGSDSGFGITVAKGATLTIDLQWAEPWNGVDTDLDAFLLDATGKPVEVESALVGSTGNNLKSQRPVEIFQWENDTGASANVQLAINRCFGVCNPEASTTSMPRLKVALLQNGSGVTATEYLESKEGDVVGPAIYGHAGAAGAIAVGAVPFNNSAKAESYSSRGPVTHYFAPVTGATGAAPLPAPLVASKPDLAATDCGVTSFFAGFSKAEGVWRFCGTSAAAPHAAAVAALVRQGNPGAGATQVRSALTATARPVGALGPEVVGAGLVDAYSAVNLLALPPTVTIVKAPEPLGRNRQPAVQFGANRPVAFSCEVDGLAQPCASPFAMPRALADGTHGFVVRATDLAGRVGSSGIVSFRIDTTAPKTFFSKRPRKLLRAKKRRVRVVFRFGSNEPDTQFICKVDRDLQRYCDPRIVRRFDEGRHVVVVKARDAAGNVDSTPAVFKLRVKRVGRGG